MYSAVLTPSQLVVIQRGFLVFCLEVLSWSSIYHQLLSFFTVVLKNCDGAIKSEIHACLVVK